ncbi:MAG: ATP-dependent DNA helicase [Patescibacteria group bacterium]|jgi:DNA helicase-2/ATP-dependent DNA helicase PcrA
MNNDYLSKLTPDQIAAVKHQQGPMMIIAGAGTGKTTVITTKIAYLVDSGVKPENILALTFTEKAAKEMSERVDILLPLGVFGVTISTFHGFSQQILRQFSQYTNISESTRLLTDLEQKLFVKSHITKFPAGDLRPLSNPTVKIEPMLNFFSRCKDELISPNKLLDFANESPENIELQELAQAYQIYQDLLLSNNFLDYGDLLMKTYELLSDHPNVTTQLRQTYQYILVDEYQDTNVAQTEIVKLLAPAKHNITVVGDDDQSIYRFRGATTGQMEQFRTHYQNCKIVTLIDNFRSPQFILDNAYALIQHNNPDRLEVSAKIDKRLRSQVSSRHGSSSAIPLRSFLTENEEARWVVSDITAKIKAGAEPEDCCVLVRTNNQSRIFAEKLTSAQIPFITKTEAGLMDDPIVKLIVYYCQVVADPHQFLPFFFLATSPIYKINPEKLIYALSETKSTHTPIEEIVARDEKLTQSCQNLLDDIAWARKQLHHLKTSDLILNWYKKRAEFFNSSDMYQDPSQIVTGLFSLTSAVQRFESLSSDNKLLHFIENLSTILSDNATEEIIAGGGVRLLTVHTAKGTEYPYVYITNLAEGRFPSINIQRGYIIPSDLLKYPIDEAEEFIKEERRLFYTAITRAKHEVSLSAARVYGSGTRERKESRFISELSNISRVEETSAKLIETSPESLVPQKKSVEVKSINPHTLQNYDDCPLKYKFISVDKLAAPSDFSANVGSLMHSLFAWFFTERQQNRLPSLDDLQNRLQLNWNNRGFLDAQHQAEMKIECQNQINNFYQMFAKLPAPDSIEHKFEVKMTTTKLVGRIDAVYHNGLGSISNNKLPLIIDFKTSSSVTNQSDADTKTKDSDQLTLYALAWQNSHNVIPQTALYFPSSNLFGIKTVTQKQIDRQLERIDKIVGLIEKEQLDATPSKFTCQYCPFAQFCPQSMSK